jgi:DNA-binding IclR family transcriptional regulator
MDHQLAQSQGTQSIDRTITLMRLVATYCPGGARLKDLAEESGLPAPTARRILKRLIDHRLIAHSDNSRYTLGTLVYELGLAANHVTAEASRYRPLIEDVGKATGDTIYLLLRSGLDCVCVDRIDGGVSAKPPMLRVGDRLPLGVGVGGMALLAALPEDEMQEVIAANQPVYKRFTRIVGSSFSDHLEAARRSGHIVRRSPVTPGVVGFGMALPNPRGAPYAAISGATPAAGFAEPRRSAVIAMVREIIAKRTACDF